MAEKNTLKHHSELTNQFIALANKMKDDGDETAIISAALMASSAIYATYATAGNDGYLQPAGIDKVTDVYKKHLAYTQQFKKAEAEQKK